MQCTHQCTAQGLINVLVRERHLRAACINVALRLLRQRQIKRLSVRLLARFWLAELLPLCSARASRPKKMCVRRRGRSFRGFS